MQHREEVLRYCNANKIKIKISLKRFRQFMYMKKQTRHTHTHIHTRKTQSPTKENEKKTNCIQQQSFNFCTLCVRGIWMDYTEVSKTLNKTSVFLFFYFG